MNGVPNAAEMPVPSEAELASQTPNKRKSVQNFGNMSSESSSCEVCSAPAVVYKQYGAVCCFSCRAFFRRNITRKFDCVLGVGSCQVDPVTRNNCRRCRMERCLQSGMKPEMVDVTVKRKTPKRPSCDGFAENLNKFVNDNNLHEIETSCEQNGIKECPQAVPNNSKLNEITEEEIHKNIDIEKIAEVCYKEEQNRICTRECPISLVVNNDEQNLTSVTILPFKKRRTDHYNAVPIKICNQPSISFTFEEEFRLHDLIVRREYLNEKTATRMENWEPAMVKNAKDRMFADMLANKKVTFDEDYLDFFFTASRKIASLILPEVFDEFKHLKKDIAYKCIDNSFPATLPLMWACLDANKDESLLEQEKFLGYGGPSYASEIEQIEKILPDIQTRKGMGMEDYSHFISPWAQSWEEEVFFETTVKTIGQLLMGDMKTSLVFQMLLLTSKPAGSPIANSGVKQVQDDLGTLLYRYLSSKREIGKAAEQVHSLMGMVDKMHRCGHILTNRRIRMLPADQ